MRKKSNMAMFNLDRFISEKITGRPESLFAADIAANRELLASRIDGRSVLVIGGAGSIGSSFIKALLHFRPSELTVVDIDENGLARLTRSLRSATDISVPAGYHTYAVDYDSDIFADIFRDHGGFDIVANFSAHKHVRSEKDSYAARAMIENNLQKARRFFSRLLSEYPPRHFFCVSTDKAANPANLMGATKRVMEDLVKAYAGAFPVTMARFANVAFSNGSLPASFQDRLSERQPLVAPSDVRRYFVSPAESGEICLLACILGRSGEIFFPKLSEEKMMTFSSIALSYLEAMGYEPLICESEDEARRIAASLPDDTRQWPIYLFRSDTTGEKDYEEFFIEGETLDSDRFRSLGVITSSPRRSPAETDAFLDSLQELFDSHDYSKEEIIKKFKSYLPNFSHEEKGRNLDQKM